MFRTAGAAFGLLCLAAPLHAKVQLNPLFADNAVLQRGGDIPVWGTAEPGEEIYVTLKVKTPDGTREEGVRTNAGKDGKWAVKLAKFDAGTEGVLTAKAPDKKGPKGNPVKDEATAKNVAVGEVWVCSGQSNMEWVVDAAETPDKIKEASKDAELRLFTVNHTTADKPATDIAAGNFYKIQSAKWYVSGPDNAGSFSAVGLSFGKELRKALKVPVGLIHTSWGGTPAEAWTPLPALEAEPALKHYADRAKAGKLDANAATSLYNGMIHPLLPYAVKGAIWYQGESNAKRAFEYRTLFPTMIESWRKAWGKPDLGFYFVQLAPYGRGTARSPTRSCARPRP